MVQRALVDLVSGSNLRRVLRDNCAWDLPPANLAEVLAAERPLHRSACSSEVARPVGQGVAASPGYTPSIAKPTPASLRELVLEEEATALQAEAAGLREQLRCVREEQEGQRRERAGLHEQIFALREGHTSCGVGDVPWAELVGTLLELCASSLHALQREVAARPAQEVARAAAADAGRAADAVQVRALSASLRECERGVVEQAAATVAARGSCAEAGLAAGAERELLLSEVRRREHAEAWAGQLRRLLREAAELERRLRAQRSCVREELRLCERECEAVRGEAAAARHAASLAMEAEAVEVERRWAWEAQQLEQRQQQEWPQPQPQQSQPQTGSSTARLLALPAASPPASLYSSLLDVNASFTWRGDDFTVPARQPPPSRAEGPRPSLAAEQREQGEQGEQREQREQREQAAEEQLAGGISDGISALQEEMDVLIGQHMGSRAGGGRAGL